MKSLEMSNKKLREFVSKKTLDFAEFLPKFQGGIIYKLQKIREHERKIADESCERLKQPEDAAIKLRSVTLVFSYEFEQFSSVHESLKMAFSNNKRFLRVIDEIRRREGKLDGSSWSDLGVIKRKENKSLFVNLIKSAELPIGVESLHLSHNRLLASLSCIECTVIVSKDFQEKIKEAADGYYLPATISESLRPSKFFRGYSMSYKEGSEIAVLSILRNYIKEVSSWLFDNLKINFSDMHFSAAHPLYQLEYLPKEMSIK